MVVAKRANFPVVLGTGHVPTSTAATSTLPSEKPATGAKCLNLEAPQVVTDPIPTLIEVVKNNLVVNSGMGPEEEECVVVKEASVVDRALEVPIVDRGVELGVVITAEELGVEKSIRWPK